MLTSLVEKSFTSFLKYSVFPVDTGDGVVLS